MIKLQVLCHSGDQEFNKETPEEIEELISKIEMGEVDTLEKGKYYIYDKNTNQIVDRQEIKAGQMLVLVPVIAGG